LPTLLPFLAARVRPLRAMATLAALTVGAGVIYVLISRQFAGNPGEQAEFHLLDNLKFYVNPMHLLASEKTYGLPLFRAYSVVGVAFLLIVGVVGWRHAPKLVRGHVLLAL